MAIDTLSLARELRDAEFAPAQAEAIATAIGRSIVGAAATKSDLRELKLELEAKIEAVGTKIEAVQGRLIMWFVGTHIAFVALIGAMIKL